MKLTSLKRKPKRSLRSAKTEVVAMDQPEYPYGLELHLDKDTISKLQIDVKNTNVGDTVHFSAKAKVKSISQNDYAGGSEKNVSIQITSMNWGKKE